VPVAPTERRLAADARAIALGGIAAADPARAIRRHLHRRGRRLVIGSVRLDLHRDYPPLVIALGKAAGPMGDAVADLLHGVPYVGLAVVAGSAPTPSRSFVTFRGGHPLPDSESVQAARGVLSQLRQTPLESPVLVLVSGGASAGFESPADGLSLSELRAVSQRMLDRGVPVQSMNTVRRHLSEVKGGWLAAAAAPRPLITLAISDVVGDAPWDIGSGPTVGDPTTFRQALKVLGPARLPPAVRRHLTQGAAGRIPETPKPKDPRLAGTSFHLLATNRMALEGAAAVARDRGYRITVEESPVTGEVQAASVKFVHRMFGGSAPSRSRAPTCHLAGGETTLRVERSSGKGGRNQEFALRAARAIAAKEGVVILSAGTDGIDGPTDAAGGWVDGRTIQRAGQMGIDIPDALADHTSYSALDRLGQLWRLGATGTNVMDVHVGLLAARRRG
jgi:glycerate 2-kinase